ncbi:MAG: ATP-binding protein [Aggregatilineaceae bacterium]
MIPSPSFTDRLPALLDHLQVGVFVSTVDGHIVYANRYVWECCGWVFEPEEAGSKAAQAQRLRERFIEQNRRVIAQGAITVVERIEEAADKPRYVEVHRFAIPSEQGETLIGGIVLDITQRVQAEQHQLLLARALEHSPAIVVITDAEGRVQYVNRRFTDLTSYSLQESLGKLARVLDPAHLTPDEYRERWDAIRAGREWQGEFLNHKKGGEPYWELTQITPLRDADGPLTHILLVRQDITRRKQAELAEREQRERAEVLSETAALLTRTLDLDHIFDHILAQAARLVPYDAGHFGILEGDRLRIVRTLGYARYGGDEAVLATSLPVDELANLRTMVSARQPVLIPDIHADPSWVHLAEPRPLCAYLGVPLVVHDEVLGILNLYSETPGFFTQERVHLVQALADQAAQALRNAQLYQSVREHAAALEDRVTERTEALRQSEERARAQYQAVPVPTFVVQHCPDGEFVLVDYNDAAYDFTAGTVTQWVNQRASVFHREYPELLELARQCYEQRTTLKHEMYLTLKATGRQYYLQITISYVPPDLLLIHSVDLTDRKRYEETLQRSLEREKYLGELRSRLVMTISHEFRTPLSIILSSADILERYSDKLTQDARRTRFAHIREASRRITTLLEEALQLGTLQAGEVAVKPEPVNVAIACEQVIAQVKGTKSDSVPVRLEVQGCVGLVLLDRGLFSQILQHLVSNAIKFSHPGGEVTVRVCCQDKRLIVQVQDEGIGIPLADRRRIFDGFHRGGNVANIPGVGLGLAIARQAVELCGGTIGFESEEGRGTTFTVTLPWIPAPAASTEESPP